MSDRELLEMAAKAAGYHYAWLTHDDRPATMRVSFIGLVEAPDAKFDTMDWNPITDDGDALRLAVALRMTLICSKGHTACDVPDTDEWVSEEAIHGEAARRVIVRAAAEIGRTMP